jgi:hypothetical protein
MVARLAPSCSSIGVGDSIECRPENKTHACGKNQMKMISLVLALLSFASSLDAQQCSGCAMDASTLASGSPYADADGRIRMREHSLWGSGVPWVPDLPIPSGLRLVAAISTDIIVIPLAGKCKPNASDDAVEAPPPVVCKEDYGCALSFSFDLALKPSAGIWSDVWGVKVSFRQLRWGWIIPGEYLKLVPINPGSTIPNELVYDAQNPAPPSAFAGTASGQCGVGSSVTPQNQLSIELVATYWSDVTAFSATWNCTPCAPASSGGG